MKKKLLLVAGLVGIVLLSGCVAPKVQPRYYYSNYSESHYSLAKNGNEENQLLHQQELEKIIAESKVRNLRVPPGIYAELGYLRLKANQNAEAVTLFQAEAKLYPESGQLMERLIMTAQEKEHEAAEQSQP